MAYAMKPERLPARWQHLSDSEFDAVLRRVAEVGDNIPGAVLAVCGPGRPPQTIYSRIASDPGARRRYEEARAQFASMLLAEATRRAVHGTDEAITYKGEITGFQKRHSDKLLELLLVNHLPSFVSKRTQGEVVHHNPDDAANVLYKFTFNDCERLSSDMRKQLLSIVRYLDATEPATPGVIDVTPDDDSLSDEDERELEMVNS
jgi:hypothetical protein